jgi:hypothetical protein
MKQIFKAPDEKGAVLITGLLLILVLTILSMAAMMSTATELKIAANDRTSKRIFLRVRGRPGRRPLLPQTGSSSLPIYDNQFSNELDGFVGTVRRAPRGFQSGNSTMPGMTS